MFRDPRLTSPPMRYPRAAKVILLPESLQFVLPDLEASKLQEMSEQVTLLNEVVYAISVSNDRIHIHPHSKIDRLSLALQIIEELNRSLISDFKYVAVAISYSEERAESLGAYQITSREIMTWDRADIKKFAEALRRRCDTPAIEYDASERPTLWATPPSGRWGDARLLSGIPEALRDMKMLEV